MDTGKKSHPEGGHPAPSHRALQVFAFDPSLDLDLETARVNRSVVEVRWETGLEPGPVGECVEVVDVDPPSKCAYAPVDLNHPHLLVSRGLAPSEGNPQFHQQMTYAVAMKTIANFEQALGRTVHWSPRAIVPSKENEKYYEEYVPRLRIYPHALREANAYYSPDKKALLFGYFNAQNVDPREGLPGGVVFTCLSHDVVAHEMTHAILDGIHRRMIEPSNEDSLAFHEAFADLIAIFQHFTLPGVLELEIAKTRGDLSTENLLAQLALQFGRAIKHGTALRDFLGERDPATGVWVRARPDPTLISRTYEPHARGAILVAAIFEAFLAIYQAHTKDLLRIASGGTGILPGGALHPDLVLRLAGEAGTVAQRLLTICIRALDYLPPVDVTFGDYVRAMITSDVDLFPDDRRHYRIALIRAFRDYGVFPRDVRTLSVESLCWNRPSQSEQDLLCRLLPPPKGLRLMTFAKGYVEEASQIPGGLDAVAATERLLDLYTQAEPLSRDMAAKTDVAARRKLEWLRERQFARYLHQVIAHECLHFDSNPGAREAIQRLLGVDPFGERRFEIHAVRPTLRLRANGQSTYELLILITQQRDERLAGGDGIGEGFSYRFRAGCTLLIDPIGGEVRYCIVKRMSSTGRRGRQEAFLRRSLRGEGPDARARFGVMFGEERRHAGRRVRQEPFRLMHRRGGQEDWS
jgi:hypothetical protein